MTDINDFGHNSFVHTKGLKERIEMTEQKELLKVLDMSEEEQYIWVINNTDLHKMPEKSLADLAFRLRDEVRRGKYNYDHAVYIVFNYEKQKRKYENVFYWMAFIAKPIHWIIASLIAKGSK